MRGWSSWVGLQREPKRRGGGSGETEQPNASSATERADGSREAEQAIELEAQERAESILLTLSDLRRLQAVIAYSDEEAPLTAYDETVVLRDSNTTAFVMTWSFLTPFNPVLKNEMIATVSSLMPD